ncbi:probable LRR receptor-like serine/threonine-protein kinase At3g47570 [Tripterygium wilfordii]|uniref:probable LRR receptor-like serine/threonine-protein kinase At3g47570 n=1 Tax=Tripterygium wilfordii TaxID=458696 RepID=UPI0018F7FCB8|nr:probable LRR receptor-like serine/threonine-protein kinase At3g47570 [Tripterygium wilfordii]
MALSVKYIRRCLQRHDRTKTESNLKSFDQIHWRRFSYRDLVQATDGFSESNLLGIGSFGRVYKGIDHYGMDFAVKVFDVELERGIRSFEVECQVMRYCSFHRNVVKVISICSNLDFKALVLEYLPNGTLEKWLHTHNYNLDILQRLNLMIDVARGLEYLHFHCAKPVVHCDLKPGNVLLDEDMLARISDFGLAKSLSDGDVMQETTTLGTLGYIAPEYGSNGLVSTKSDVYSFGIMMMETFTGKRPIDEMFAGEVDLRWWVKESILLDAIDRVADANLLRVGDELFESATKTCIKSIFNLALICSAKSAIHRLDMKQVLTGLERTKAAFLKDIEID